MDRKNRRALPHRLERCGYVSVRNPEAKDGVWKSKGERLITYAKASLTPQERVAAARKLLESGGQWRRAGVSRDVKAVKVVKFYLHWAPRARGGVLNKKSKG